MKSTKTNFERCNKVLLGKGIKLGSGHARWCVEQLTNLKALSVRPCTQSGSGNYSKQIDCTAKVCEAMDALMIPYQLTNYAPRGGLRGNVITLV